MNGPNYHYKDPMVEFWTSVPPSLRNKSPELYRGAHKSRSRPFDMNVIPSNHVSSNLNFIGVGPTIRLST